MVPDDPNWSEQPDSPASEGAVGFQYSRDVLTLEHLSEWKHQTKGV
ncbi:hypothetical protein [Deinococcus sp.]|nr:hypothetical protein [Deinococcus sp.]